MAAALKLINSVNGGNKISVHVNDKRLAHWGLNMGNGKYNPFDDLRTKGV